MNEKQAFFTDNLKSSIRLDVDLLTEFIKLFEGAFGFQPTCTGCTFNNDYEKLKRFIMEDTDKKETTKEYKISTRHYNDILTYTKNKKVYRSYGRNLTNEFAKEFLKYGAPPVLTVRRKMFDVIAGKDKTSKKKK